MEITETDREEFPHHTDNAIIGTKTIRAKSDDELLKFVEDEDHYLTILSEFAENTNPSWIEAQVAYELYDRGLIDAQTQDRMAGD